jgi:hypothetical protein
MLQSKAAGWLNNSSGKAKQELTLQPPKKSAVDAKAELKSKATTLLKPFVSPGPASGVASVFWFHRYQAEKSAPQKTDAQLSSTAAKLRQLVLQVIEADPFEREGFVWAKRSQLWYAEQLGVSERQVRRLVKEIPLCQSTVKLDGHVITLLRVGNLAEKSPEAVARIMSQLWQKKVGRRPTPHEFGLLVGLAKDWPPELALDFLVTLIDNWPIFMQAVKLHVDLAKTFGDFHEPDPDAFYSRFLSFPSISVIRRFYPLAVPTYELLLSNSQ